MKTARKGATRLAGLALVALLAAPALQAQTTTMPSTLRYGSGLLDIPVSSVLPHMAITGTYSGFFLGLDRTVDINAGGDIIGYAGGRDDKWYSDASVAMGLFDRVEVGTTIQSLNDAGAGGNIWGLFGRVNLFKPTNQGLGLAVGARYVTAPDFVGVNAQPTRIGIPDVRFRETYTGKEDVATELSLYGVTSAHIRGFDDGFLPKHDLTLSLGYGTGMFQDGDKLPFYKYASTDGWFFGSALHFGIGENSILTFMGEYNGFDANLGAQLDFGGLRLGAHYLAANYTKPANGYWSEYRKPKFGFLASVAICPNGGGLLCKPKLMERPQPQVIQLPAPPADTVRITREVERALPDGTPATVCLATGENVEVRVTAQGDTLVGPTRASIKTLRPGVVFAGTYAEGRDWFTSGADITFEKARYTKSGEEVRLDCAQIMRVGENMGVPLFAMRNAERPYPTIYVPVRPGVWQAYQTGMRRTRG
ncbi:MAG TPA: hypothetical protein VLH75_15490 [Longimicrobiales bacterium]|nr:hypothetical protein [Longimicrobiales bacterium]